MTEINLVRRNVLQWMHQNYSGDSLGSASALLEKSSLIGDDSKEVIPYFAINRLARNSGAYGRRWTNDLNITCVSEDHFIHRFRFNHSYIVTALQLLFKLTIEDIKPVGTPSWKEINLTEIPIRELKRCINDCIEGVYKHNRDYINLSLKYAMPDSIINRWSPYWKYKSTLNHFLAGIGWATQCTRTYINGVNLKYLVGPHFLADISGENIIPLICLVTKPKYIKNIRQGEYLETTIDSRYFQIWINPQFDIPGSIYKGIRPFIRKEFLIPLYDAGIPVVEKNNFNELFKQYTPPVFSGISGYREWLKKCSIEIINNINK